MWGHEIAKLGGTMSTKTKTSVRSAIFGAFVAALAAPVAAQGIEFKGELSFAARHFPHDGAQPGQATSGTSLITEGRLVASSDLGFGQVEIELYGRGDNRTGSEVIDIQKAYFQTGNDFVSVLVGSDVVFWGVAESVNPTNIINQNDLFSRIEEERKLGQPMVNLNFETGVMGTVSLYGLIGFREPDFGDASTRPRFAVLPDDSRAMFDDVNNHDFDIAIRNTNTISFSSASLDYAVSYFQGTNRNPVVLPGCANRAAPVTEATCTAVNTDIRNTYESLAAGGPGALAAQVAAGATPATQAFLLGGTSVGTVPYYQDIQQVGLELAYASGDWLWKFEGIRRYASGEDFFGGVFGAEYRFNNVFGGSGDLTIAGEYAYDDRSSLQPITVFDDDVFASVRYDFNNPYGTAITLSGLRDVNTDGSVYNLEVSSRLTDSTTVNFTATHINSSSPTDPLTVLNNDDFYELKFSYFF